jgi:hypothetical protein
MPGSAVDCGVGFAVALGVVVGVGVSDGVAALVPLDEHAETIRPKLMTATTVRMRMRSFESGE